MQLGEIRLAVYSNENAIYGLDNIPNLASTYGAERRLTEVQKPYFDKLLDKQGMKIIAYEPWPGQGFYTKKKVNSLKDLKGQKIRIYSKLTEKMARMVGMNPTILPFADVPQAFSTSLIEAMWTSAQTGTDVQAWDFTKYFTYTGSEHNKNAFLVNKKALDSLDKKTRKIVLAAGRHATKRAWKMSKAAQKRTTEELKKHGMKISDAPQDVTDKMDEIGKKLAEEWKQKADPAQKAVLKKYYESSNDQASN